MDCLKPLLAKGCGLYYPEIYFANFMFVSIEFELHVFFLSSILVFSLVIVNKKGKIFSVV